MKAYVSGDFASLQLFQSVQDVEKVHLPRFHQPFFHIVHHHNRMTGHANPMIDRDCSRLCTEWRSHDRLRQKLPGRATFYRINARNCHVFQTLRWGAVRLNIPFPATYAWKSIVSDMASTSVRSLRKEAFENARAFANQYLHFFACKFRVVGKAERGP